MWVLKREGECQILPQVWQNCIKPLRTKFDLPLFWHCVYRASYYNVLMWRCVYRASYYNVLMWRCVYRASYCNVLMWHCVYRASYCNVLITNEMHSYYNQFLFHSFYLQTKNCGIKIDYKNCASCWLLTHCATLSLVFSTGIWPPRYHQVPSLDWSNNARNIWIWKFRAIPFLIPVCVFCQL
jgi:hypothetical protein